MNCLSVKEHSAMLRSEKRSACIYLRKLQPLWFDNYTKPCQDFSFILSNRSALVPSLPYKICLRLFHIPLFCTEYLCKKRHLLFHLRCEVITRADLLRRKTLKWKMVPANKTHQPLHWKSSLRFVQAHVDCAYESKSQDKVAQAQVIFIRDN